MLPEKFKRMTFILIASGVAALAGDMVSLTSVTAADSKGVGVNIQVSSGRRIKLYTGSYALIIGVSRYTEGWPNLESVPAEIDEVQQILSAHQFKIKKVMNPTSTQLVDAVNTFIDEHGFDPGNCLLFFFSGHGHSRFSGTKGYLVPADAPDPHTDEKGFLKKAVAMTQVLEWSRRIEAKHALFVFDSCFAGTVFKTKSLPAIPPHISDITAQPVREFISAGSAGEAVPAKSVFVPSFIRALKGDADLNQDSYVTGTELGMYLHQKVLSYQTGQTPQYGKIRDPDLDEGDIVFSLQKGQRSIADKQPRTASPQIPAVSNDADTSLQDKSTMLGLYPKKTTPRPPQKEAEQTRYVVRENGIVYDTETGLEWVVGPDKDTSFQSARIWSQKLALDGGQWRMPTRSELKALYEEKGRRARNLPHWVNLTGSGIWSNHIKFNMRGGEEYYYYANGVEFTSPSIKDALDKRALSVRQGKARR